MNGKDVWVQTNVDDLISVQVMYAPSKPGDQPSVEVKTLNKAWNWNVFVDLRRKLLQIHWKKNEEYISHDVLLQVSKEFMMSPNKLHLECSLDKELYYHGETISVNVHIQASQIIKCEDQLWNEWRQNTSFVYRKMKHGACFGIQLKLNHNCMHSWLLAWQLIEIINVALIRI